MIADSDLTKSYTYNVSPRGVKRAVCIFQHPRQLPKKHLRGGIPFPEFSTPTPNEIMNHTGMCVGTILQSKELVSSSNA